MSKLKAGRAPAVSTPARSKAKSRSLPVIGLILLVLAVYAPVRHYPFVNWDDAEYVAENPHVIAGLTGETIKWASTANTAGNWHPVTMLSHALVVELFGRGPEPQHI